MSKRLVLTVILIAVLIGMSSLSFNVQKVEASGTIYIRADGSIDPPTAPIATVDNVTYTFTGNIADSIFVERGDIVVDGVGYNVQGSGSGDGFYLFGINNVTLKNTDIKNFTTGIELLHSSNNTVSGNNLTNNFFGIQLGSSSNTSVSANNVADNSEGIELYDGSYENIVSGNNITNTIDWGVALVNSSNNKISGNNITNNHRDGIQLYSSSNCTFSGNNITNNGRSGVYLDTSSSNNISGNDITANNNDGIYVGISSSNNSVTANNITNNEYGIDLYYSSNNRLWHNNFIDNTQQVSIEVPGYPNVWDDGYPSGGNHWSDYSGVDEKSGPYQDMPGSDGIGDTPYALDENNSDRNPLLRPWPPLEHELLVSMTAPASLQLGSASSLNATVINEGLNDEVNVEFQLLINDTIANTTTILLLHPWNSYTLTYLWTPTAKSTYNVTAYAYPVLGEAYVENNQKTKFVTVAVSAPSSVQVGVKAGDWIRCSYTLSGWPSGTPYPKWLKVEFLSVEETNATVRVTMHMSDGTEPSQTMPVDVGAGGGAFQGLSGFVIPANCTTGDSIYMSGYGNVTIAGETTGSYAGATRTVVYASFSQYGTQLTYRWDKLTGVIVEASVVSGGVTATGKATDTSMWQAASSGFPIDPIYLYVLAVLAIIIVVGAAVFIMRRRKKPPEGVENSKSELRLTGTGFRRNLGHRITHVQTEW